MLIRRSVSLKFLFTSRALFLFFPLLLSSCSNPEEPVYGPIMHSFSTVAYSSDNGITWNIVYISEDKYSLSMHSIASLDGGHTLTGLSYFSILRSENKGVNWSQILPEYRKKITGTGIMNTGVMIGFGGEIFRTTDNGNTFSNINSGTTSYFRDVSIDSGSGTGYITGLGVILKSTDLGQTWLDVPVNDSVIYYFNAINQFDSNKIYIAGHKYLDYQQKLFKSNDGFKTFTAIDYPYYRFEINSISFLDENIGITTTNDADGSIARTTDGGLTWNKIILSGDPYIGIVKFINGTCFATSISKIHSSSDLGLTWTATQLSDSYSFSDIYSPSPGVIYMSGSVQKTLP